MTTDLSLERSLPCSLESERAVLGAILLDSTSSLPGGERSRTSTSTSRRTA